MMKPGTAPLPQTRAEVLKERRRTSRYKRPEPKRPGQVCWTRLYRILFEEEPPKGWLVETVFGLTDHYGQEIQIAAGLTTEERTETLVHEFLHMRAGKRKCNTRRFQGEVDRLLKKLNGIQWAST